MRVFHRVEGCESRVIDEGSSCSIDAEVKFEVFRACELRQEVAEIHLKYLQ